MRGRTTAPARYCLLTCLLAALCSPVSLPAQVGTWRADFNDPAEAARWQVYPPGAGTVGIQWEIAPRNVTDPSEGTVLKVRATGTGEAETRPYGVYREFPADFRPENAYSLAFNMEWRLSDVDHSDGVTLALVMDPSWGGGRIDLHQVFISHSRFTMGWPVLFDPADKWIPHHITTSGMPGRDERAVRGIALIFVAPVEQVVEIASLSVEEWPGGTLEPDYYHRPHRVAPLAFPFREEPLHALRRTTTGALEDLDGDGMPDLLVMVRQGYSHLYLNDGSGRFRVEMTQHSGLDLDSMGTGILFVDLDADRDLDLVTTAEFDVPRLFENLGNLKFGERRVLGDDHLDFWMSGAAEDVDRDGFPDLMFSGPFVKPLLVKNPGKWGFVVSDDIVYEQGWPRGSSFSSSFADIDRDGWPDNFMGAEYLLHNQDGRLLVDPEPWPNLDSGQTEGGLFADLNGDGELDLLILRDSREPWPGATRFLIGDGKGGFADSSSQSGIPPLVSAEVALAEDFDNDGDLDLYICQDVKPNYLLLNDGAGVFGDATDRAGFNDSGGCDAAIAGDLDGDGGIDVLILRYGSNPRILYNRMERGNWVGVVVQSGGSGADAAGAEVLAVAPGTDHRIQTRWVRYGRGFGPTGPSELRFGLAGHPAADIEVRFPGGHVRRLHAIPAGSTVLVQQETGTWPGRVRRLLAEWRFPVVRAFRLALNTREWIPLLMAVTALVLGVVISTLRRAHIAAGILLLLGAFAGLFLGSVPGRGIPGSPLMLWSIGAMAGVISPRTIRGAHWIVKRLSRPVAPAAVPIEDIIRYTHDFRHAGLETRMLLSVHGRVKNLFLSGQVHLPFLEAIREQASRYREETAPRFRQLLGLVRPAFPELDGLDRVTELVTDLEAVFGEIPAEDASADSMRNWRTHALTLLQEMQEAVPALLDRLDRRCSCEVAGVLEEARRLRSDACRAKGIEVVLRLDAPREQLAGLITRIDLLTVLENLFTNAIAAMEASGGTTIRIVASRRDNRIRIEFHDNGPEVPPGNEEKIFQYGFSTRAGGKGYGLPRSREILGHYGGSMTLVRSEERGACFQLVVRAVTEGRG
jgi:signal transduction histidine kinase